MSIKALPAEASRLLDASSFIASPVSLVKELLDNAIDAQATCIEVLIALNTVDKIEVRDNGQGILRADFDLLGRPGHTSKLTSLEDLHTRTGDAATLGFRGQGLAAATTLGYVSVTTRTRADPVATTFRLGPSSALGGGGGGGIIAGSRKTSPAPVGTSIAVTCLFHSLPVRRRAAMQDSAKAVNAIKSLLCGYALAQPHLRLSFKVFQKPGLAWTYSHHFTQQTSSTGRTNGVIDMREAVRVLFGNELARQCQDVVASAAELLALSDNSGQLTPGQILPGGDAIYGLVFEAFLPRREADLSKLAVGGFISVDGRPLSYHHRGGIVYKLLSLFQTYLARSAVPGTHQRRCTRETFIRLNIRCPAGSYDPNVEPSKTDVLFAHESVLCDAFKRLCSRLYGTVEPSRIQTVSTVRHCTTAGARFAPGGRCTLRQSSIVGMTVRPSAIPHGGPVTPASESHSSSVGPMEQQLRPGMACSRPRNEERRVTTAGVMPKGVQRREVHGRHHMRTAESVPEPRRRRGVRGLQTPPPSSPQQHHQGVCCGRQKAKSPDHADLPGLVSNDAYRQTTLSFGRPAGEVHVRQAAVESNASAEISVPAVGSGIAARPCPQGFTTATEFQRGQNAIFSETRATETLVLESSSAKTWSEAGLITTGRDNGRKRRRQAPIRKPVYVLELDHAELKRAFARFKSDGDWKGEFACLSPDMDDISAVKRRLRKATVSWLAKTEANQKGGTPAEIEFYLKRGLKGKHKQIVRSNTGGQGVSCLAT